MEFIKIGQLFKPIGTQGELKIDIEDMYWHDFFQNNHFFIKINGCFVPYFIENVKEKNHLLLKIEEIDTPEMAADFNLKEMYLREQDIKSKEASEHKTLTSLENYTIYNLDVKIGEIVSIEEYPQQIIATVLYQNKQVLVPLVNGLIQNVDHETHCIIMNLPEGLLDV